MLVTTNHMVETDKLQSEVSSAVRWVSGMDHLLLSVLCLDIKFEETAGTERPGTEREGQAGKEHVMI